MKIKISPSYPDEGYVSVEIDTLTNEDSTLSAVDAALAAVEASGHSVFNIIDAASGWCDASEAVLNRHKEDKHI